MRGISAGGTLARYFSARFLAAMVAMFLICCVLIFFVDFIEMLRRAGDYSGDIPGILLAWMTLLRLPSFSELTLPFAVLIGTIVIFLMLSRSSELVVLRAAGIWPPAAGWSGWASRRSLTSRTPTSEFR